MWWALVHTGVVRVLAFATPVAVVVLYVASGLLWAVLVSIALWVLAVFCGRVALWQAPRLPQDGLHRVHCRRRGAPT